MSPRAQKIWTTLILGSLGFQVAVSLLIWSSEVRWIGFNTPITWQHVWSTLPEFSIASYLGTIWFYPLAGFVAHIVALGFVWDSTATTSDRQFYFGLQLLLFPLGWIPFFWPAVAWMLAVIAGIMPVDRESMDDGFFGMAFATTLWWLVSATIFMWNLALEDEVLGSHIRGVNADGFTPSTNSL